MEIVHVMSVYFHFNFHIMHNTIDILYSFSGIEQTSRFVVHKLWHPYDHTMEEKQRRRARVQRLRTLLQTSRRQQTTNDEKRRHPDKEEKT